MKPLSEVNYKIKKYQLYTLLLTVLSGLFITQGCKKENATKNENVVNSSPLIGVPNCNAKIEDGILKFATKEDGIRYTHYIQNLSTHEADQLEQNNNFISYNRKVRLITEELSNLATDSTIDYEGMQRLKSKYQDYVKINDTEIVENIFCINSRYINSKGWVQFGDFIELHTGDKVYSTHYSQEKLIRSGDYKNPLVLESRVSSFDPRSTSGARVNMWENFITERTGSCYRKPKVKLEVQWRQKISSERGVSYTWEWPPGLWNSIYMGDRNDLEVSFRVKAKHLQKVLGVYFLNATDMNLKGNYHAKNRPYVNFDDNNHTSRWVKDYNVIYWSQGWNYGNSTIVVDSDPNAWANSLLWNYWMYVQGTLTVSECGSISIAF